MPDETKRLRNEAASTAAFAGFDFDLRTAELSKDGATIALPLQAARLLSLLILKPKSLVERAEIQNTLWPDRHVDFDAGINTAIRQIRRALNDNPASPKFIETVPKRGYRFLCEPRFAGQDRESNAKFRPILGKRRILALAFATCLIVIVGSYLALLSEDTRTDHNEEQKLVQSPAYKSYLFARHSMKQGAYEQAKHQFEDAISQDELFAPAHAGLAHAIVLTRGRGMKEVAVAQEHLDHSLTLDPDNVEAIHLNARLALYYWRDFNLAQREIDRALAGASRDPSILSTKAYYHTITGERDLALDAIGHAHRSSPLSPSLNADYGWVHYKARNWADAERLCKASHELDPSSQFALECIIHINHSQGDFAEAADYGVKLMRLRGASDTAIAALHDIDDAVARENAYWRWALDWIDSDTQTDRHAKRAVVLAILGRLDEAIASLDMAFAQNGEPILSFVAVDPRFDELRRHPRFDEFSKRSQRAVAAFESG